MNPIGCFFPIWSSVLRAKAELDRKPRQALFLGKKETTRNLMGQVLVPFDVALAT